MLADEDGDTDIKDSYPLISSMRLFLPIYCRFIGDVGCRQDPAGEGQAGQSL
jgi:hypothetical protein